MTNPGNLKLLFIINPRAGKNKTDWPRVIQEFFKPLNHATELFNLPNPCTHTVIKQRIEEYKPDRVVSVGGDGTVKLVAECLFQKNIPIGILPAGSANGMAKELNIPLDPRRALDAAIYGFRKKIHLIKINNEFCIHLSDIGFNAL